jgi:type IV pilus assembly protein PilA
MRTELTGQFLHHLNRKQDDKGFTLVELLVVIIIIGILAAIALPNFLNQSAKAKQTEAKQNIGLFNRAQISYRTENQVFAGTFDTLAIGSLSGTANTASTSNYNYRIDHGGAVAVSIIANTIDTALKDQVGAVVRFTNSQNQSVMDSVICEANLVGTNQLAGGPYWGASGTSCYPNSHKI